MAEITVNGESRKLPRPLLLVELLAELGLDSSHIAVEVNREVVPRRAHAVQTIQPGDAVEIVTLVGGGSSGSEPPADKPLTIGKFVFHSRLITGTGKYSNFGLMRDCLD